MDVAKEYLKELTYEVIGGCIDVHKALGPGLLESVYHKCLAEELRYREINFISEIEVPIKYRSLEFSTPLKADFFIENCLVLELKTVDFMLPVHEAQVLSYMKLLKSPKGILVNFKCNNIFNEGQKTFVNEYFKKLR